MLYFSCLSSSSFSMELAMTLWRWSSRSFLPSTPPGQWLTSSVSDWNPGLACMKWAQRGYCINDETFHHGLFEGAICSVRIKARTRNQTAFVLQGLVLHTGWLFQATQDTCLLGSKKWFLEWGHLRFNVVSPYQRPWKRNTTTVGLDLT